VFQRKRLALFYGLRLDILAMNHIFCKTLSSLMTELIDGKQDVGHMGDTVQL
jgi:hypothetical protein